MSWQKIELNMIPDTKVLPVVHASQFDSNRSISFQMFTGDDEWTIPEGLTIELHCRKVDDNIVTLAPFSVVGSVITFITTEQLTACSGQNKCELSFIDADDLVIGSLNFVLDVEPDPLKGGLTSASSIYDLTQQIEDITQEVIGDDYYNKTEVDTLLADKADVTDLPDMSQYYTKTATDTLLNAKADAATTYTKSETDSLLSAKANTADLATVATTGDYDDLLNKPTIPAAQIQSDYTQADTTAVDYIKNKPDINAMIADALLAVMPVETATGNPCTFDTDIATELQGLTADIVASGGGGTPSTPIPIVGYTELNLTHNGRMDMIALGSTVYGGELDVTSGVLTITHALLEKAVADMNNWEDFPGWNNSGARAILETEGVYTVQCNIGNTIATNFIGNNDVLFLPKASYGGLTQSQWIATYPDLIVQILLPFNTPQTVQLTPTQVQAIVGVNNIVSDCNGDVTASYKVSIQKYVDDQ